jgi:recombination protein RecA
MAGKKAKAVVEQDEDSGDETGKEKDKRKSTAIEALVDAFARCKDIRPVNLERGSRVSNTLSTGSLMIDLILGGGFQRGRIASIFGPEGTGKSTLLQSIIASAQAKGIPVVHFDPETSADPTYMRAQGINLRHTVRCAKKSVPGYFYTQTSTGEEIYRFMQHAMNRMPEFPFEQPGLPATLFVTDSMAAMLPEAVDLEEGKRRPGLVAKMNSDHIPLVRAHLARTGCLWVFSNQLRHKIDIGPVKTAGPMVFDPGGEAVKFYPDYKLKLSPRRVESDKGGLKVLPFVAYTTKNKTFPPFQEAKGSIVLGRGVDKAQDAHEFLMSIGRLEIKGGKRRIMLKRFDQGYLAWKDFRRVSESPEFRDFCFGLLQRERVYVDYFKAQGFTNYIYDLDAQDDTAVAPSAVPDDELVEDAG